MTRPTGMAVLLRLVMLVTGIVLVLAPAPINGVTAALTAIGVLAALGWPAQVGASIATAGFVASWLAGHGLYGVPPVSATIAAAAALYVLHTTTALAAFVPLSAHIDHAVIRRHATRCIPAVLTATTIIAVDYTLTTRHGSPLVQLVGLVAVLLIVAVAARRVAEPQSLDSDQP